jgi:hypothetical protein
MRARDVKDRRKKGGKEGKRRKIERIDVKKREGREGMREESELRKRCYLWRVSRW